jgi:sugar phosphate isomerase/epimerase
VLQTRRTFLKESAAAAAAAAALGRSVGSAADGTARGFKYSICNETFRDWPQEKVFGFAAGCGYRGVEIAPFTIRNLVTEVSAEDRARLRREAQAAGVEIVGLHWLLAKTEGFHLTSPDQAVRRRTSEYLAKLAGFCADLGGSVMVFGSPKQRNLAPGVTRAEGLRHAAEVLRAVLPTLEKRGVVIALEPLSPKTTNFLTTAAEALELADLIDSPHCRLLLDCLAMSSESVPIPELIGRYAPRLAHFHANDPNSLGPAMGTLDFTPIFKALRAAGYRGWISVEVFETGPGPEEVARRSIEYMKRVETGLNG